MYTKRNNELEIISLFRGKYNKRIYLREISRLSKLALKTCQNTIKKLEENKILKSEIEGKNKYFSLNTENINTKFALLQTEIYETSKFIHKHPEFKIFLKSIKNNNPILIFGSYAKSTENKNSDIDILIIKNKKIDLQLELLIPEIHKIELNEKLFYKAIKEEENIMQEIEENHIILNNHSFYVNSMWGKYGN